MSTTAAREPRNMHAVDILEQVSTITRFLAEIAPMLHDQGAHAGLSERGACGLYYILDDLHNRIELAIDKM